MSIRTTFAIKETRGYFIDHFGHIPSWNPESKNPKKNSFTVHSLVRHIFCTLLQIATCGLVQKSFKVTLHGKSVYVNSNSYGKWRKINQDDIDSIPFNTKRTSNSTEMTAISCFLEKTLNERTGIISTSKNPFQLGSFALQRAQRQIDSYRSPIQANPQIVKKVKRELAAFHALVAASYFNCDQQLVLSTANQNIVGTEKAFLKDADLRKWDKKVYEQGENGLLTERTVYRQPDTLSSVDIATNPVSAKESLNSLIKADDNFYLTFPKQILSQLHSGASPIFTDPKQQEFYGHLIEIGTVIEQQFQEVDVTPIVDDVLRQSFLKWQDKMTEKNQYTFGALIGIWVAFQLLKDSTCSHEADGSKVVHCAVKGHPVFFLRFPKKNLFKDKNGKIPYVKPFINPLSGHFPLEACCVGKTFEGRICSYEALEVAEGCNLLSKNEKKLLEKNIEIHMNNSLLIEKAPIVEEFKSIIGNLEELGKLMDYRYFQVTRWFNDLFS